MLRNILFAILLLSAGNLFGQKPFVKNEDKTGVWFVYGLVNDAMGHPIAGATVVLHPFGIGSVSDSEGNYKIECNSLNHKSVSSDSLYTEASCLGFYAERHLVKPKTQRIDFGLREKSTTLQDVVVTAQRSPKMMKDVPEVIRLISRKDIEEAQVQSLPQLLEMELPGIEFTRTEGMSNQMSLNGFGSKYVLFLIDGERMSGETSHENVDYQRIDIDQVERVEIVRGGMSTLYGSGAIAGVVNVITRNANKPWSAQLNAQYSTEGEQKYGFSAGFKKKAFSSYTSGSYRRKTAYFLSGTDSMSRHYSDGSVEYEAFMPPLEIEGFQNFNVSQRFRYQYGKGEKAGSGIDVKGSYYGHERFNALPVGELLHHLYSDGAASIKWTHVFDTIHSIELSYAFDNYAKYNKYLKLDEVEKNYEDVTHNPRFIYRGNYPHRNQFLLGMEVFYEQLSTYQFSVGGSNESHSQIGYWLYAQDDWRALKWLTISGGLRMEYYKNNGFVFVPKLNLMAQTHNITFRLGYASGFRTPTLKEMYTNWDHQGMFELVGSSDLRPEKSHNVSAAIEYNASWWSAGVNAHYHWLNDKIATLWNASQDTAFYANVNKAQLAGLDAHIDFNLPLGFAIRASYAYVYDRQMQDSVNIASSRPHSATMRLEYSYRWRNHGFSARLSGRYLSGMAERLYDDNRKMWYELHYDPYFLLNLGVAMQFPYGIKISAGINNMLNYKPKIVTYNAGISKGITFTAGISWQIDAISNRYLKGR